MSKPNPSNKTIQCASCGKMHRIGTLEAIQTYWYSEPSGCTEGDHWNEGEMQFVCPVTKIRNRIYFFQDYHERKRYDIEEDFNIKFSDAFKTVTDYYDHGEDKSEFVNNHYVNKHRKKFGLKEKP